MSKKWPTPSKKRPTMCKKRPETTYNEQETTWNNLQRARNNLKRPTTSKKQPETTYNEQETTWNNPLRVRHNLQGREHTYNEQRKDAKRPTTSRFSDYFTIWGKRFSSLTFFSNNIWLQSFEHCFTENHVENGVSTWFKHQLWCVFFTGYKIYLFLSGFRVSRERERLFS